MNDTSFDINKLPELIKNIKELIDLLPSTKNKLSIVEYILFESGSIPEEHIPQAFEYVLDNPFFQARKFLSDDTRKDLLRRFGGCERCGSSDIRKNGTREGKQQYLCKKCKYQFVK